MELFLVQRIVQFILLISMATYCLHIEKKVFYIRAPNLALFVTHTLVSRIHSDDGKESIAPGI